MTPEDTVKYDVFSITSTFWELRSRGGLFNPRNLLGLLIPKVVSNMLDAKSEVDAVLRRSIVSLTSSFADKILAPIVSALPAVANDHLPTQNQAQTQAPPQPQRKPLKFPATEASARTTRIRELLVKETPPLRSHFEAYVSDVRTREMLIVACWEAVITGYADWYACWSEAGTPMKGGKRTPGSTGRSKGKGSIDEVWDVDVFEEWGREVMGVGNAGSDVFDGGAAEEEAERRSMGLGLGLGLNFDGDGGEDRGDDEEDDAGSMTTGTGKASSMGTGLRIRM